MAGSVFWDRNSHTANGTPLSVDLSAKIFHYISLSDDTTFTATGTPGTAECQMAVAQIENTVGSEKTLTFDTSVSSVGGGIAVPGTSTIPAIFLYDDTQAKWFVYDPSVQIATTSVQGLMSAAMVTKLNGIATGATAGFSFAATSDDLDGTSEQFNFQTNQHNYRTISADTTITATGTPASGDQTIATLIVNNTDTVGNTLTLSTGISAPQTTIYIPSGEVALLAFWKHSSLTDWEILTDTQEPYNATDHDKSTGYTMVAGDFLPYPSKPGKVNLMSGVTALTLNTGLTWTVGARCIVTNEGAGSVTLGGTATRSGAAPTTLEQKYSLTIEMGETTNEFYFS